jgi:EcoRII C terminal
MKWGSLSDYFDGVAVKTLSAVDTTLSKSNQHEIGTTRPMREQFLGSEKKRFEALYFWLDDNEQAISHDDWATHYDTREHQPKRSAEWRLYYPSNPITELMVAGDTLFLAKRKGDDRIVFAIAKPGSTTERQLLWLFGLQRPGDKFSSVEFQKNDGTELGFAGHLILDELGIEREDSDADKLDAIISKFGGEFPTTKLFSELARKTCTEVSPLDSPDATIETWLAHEEALFRRLERQALKSRLESGFKDSEGVDVEGFLRFSLGVQNRRKSRMGWSFEHHLTALFEAWQLKFSRNAITENKQKPDFLFPDLVTYQNASFGSPAIMMLGAKSTCKDRWRQILSEAEKIQEKHLATLEPGISSAQTDQMKAHRVQLIVPAASHKSYTDDQQSWLWSLRDFMYEVRSKQLPP